MAKRAAENTTAVELTAEEWRLVAEHRAREKAREKVAAELLDPARPPTLTLGGEPVSGVGQPEVRGNAWVWRPYRGGEVDGVMWPDEPMSRGIRTMGFDGKGDELSIRV